MAKPKSTPDDRQLLLQMVEEAYRLPNWNETNLRSALRRVSPEMAAWRPPFAKRSIADITVHCAYYKYALWRRLSEAKRGSFPLKGSGWFKTPPTLTREKWSEYLALLETEHEKLVDAIQNSAKPLSHLKPLRFTKWSTVQTTYWLAIHDGYHTGQINMIKAMYRRSMSK